MTTQDIDHLKTIREQMVEANALYTTTEGFSIPLEVLGDEIEWLDSFIERNERKVA